MSKELTCNQPLATATLATTARDRGLRTGLPNTCQSHCAAGADAHTTSQAVSPPQTICSPCLPASKQTCPTPRRPEPRDWCQRCTETLNPQHGQEGCLTGPHTVGPRVCPHASDRETCINPSPLTAATDNNLSFRICKPQPAAGSEHSNKPIPQPTAHSCMGRRVPCTVLDRTTHNSVTASSSKGAGTKLSRCGRSVRHLPKSHSTAFSV